MFKVGDKVKVIEENLQYKDIDEYNRIKRFIDGNNDFFKVSYVFKYNVSFFEIEKSDGFRMTFFENELEKVVE